MSQDADKTTVAPNPAETYESYFVPAIFTPWATEILGRITPRPGDRVLDVACGTGALTHQIAPLVGSGGKIVGLDFSPGMLAVAGAKPALNGAAITWQEGRAENIPFPDASFDLVLCQQGLQFFPDRLAAVGEMRRVLAPGGRVGISVWQSVERQPMFLAFESAIERHLGAPEQGGPLSFGDATKLRSLLEDAGFHDVSVESVTRDVCFPQPEQFVQLTILGAAAVKPEYARMDEPARDALVAAVRRDIDGTLRHYRDGDFLVFPMAANIAVAHV